MTGTPSLHPRLAAFVCTLVLGAASGCNRVDAVETPPALDRAAEAPAAVETRRVGRGRILEHLVVPASLLASRESHMAARVSGRIERVFVQQGDRVEAGDPLFRVEAAPYHAALRRAVAGLDLVTAQRARAEADLARAESLVEAGILAPSRVEALVTERAVAKARESQASEAVIIAQQDLDDTLVRAPYAGSVARRLADEGTSVTRQPATTVVVIQETGTLEARANIAETHFSWVRIGDPARLFVEGIPEPIETQVSAISDTVDLETRTVRVRMRVPNPERRYKAGIFARAEIALSAKSDVLLIPRAALRVDGAAPEVFAVRDDRVVAVPVVLGIVSETSAEILSGLAEGDEYVASDSVAFVEPGLAIRGKPRNAGDAGK